MAPGSKARLGGKAGQTELRTFDRQLRAWLGSNGYRCLLACAVYPGIAWNLTLHLALALIPGEEREITLARLVRLPWFRHGRMPEWLREFFTRKLDSSESPRVVKLLQDFLESKDKHQNRRVGELEFVKITEELREQHKPPTRDYVFLSCLLGRKPRLREIEAPGWLRHMLYPEGLPVLGLRRGMWLIMGLIVSGLVMYGAEKFAHPRPLSPKLAWREITPPAPIRTESVNALSARALEIAASRLGQPADYSYASWSIDQAVQFSTPYGARLNGPARPGTVFQPSSPESPPALVEQVVEGGLILLEPFQGRLRRVFRQRDQLSGVFNETSVPVRIENGVNSWIAQFSDGRALQLMIGDITSFRADAIVNYTNPSLKNERAGVDAAINAVGGPIMQKELDAISLKYKGRAPAGTIAVTHAGQLPARFVFHVVSPISNLETQLALCYRNLFQEATRRGITSLSIPSISTYSFDAEVEMKTALDQLKTPESSVRLLTFVLHDTNAFQFHLLRAAQRLQILYESAPEQRR